MRHHTNAGSCIFCKTPAALLGDSSYNNCYNTTYKKYYQNDAEPSVFLSPDDIVVPLYLCLLICACHFHGVVHITITLDKLFIIAEGLDMTAQDFLNDPLFDPQNLEIE